MILTAVKLPLITPTQTKICGVQVTRGFNGTSSRAWDSQFWHLVARPRQMNDDLGPDRDWYAIREIEAGAVLCPRQFLKYLPDDPRWKRVEMIQLLEWWVKPIQEETS